MFIEILNPTGIYLISYTVRVKMEAINVQSIFMPQYDHIGYSYLMYRTKVEMHNGISNVYANSANR